MSLRKGLREEMENKKDRLLLESEVIAAVDKHTNNYNRLDNDITCILEEVKEKARMVTSKADNYKFDDFVHQLTIPPMPEVKKKESKFPTIRKFLNEYEDIDDEDGLGEAFAYAIYKDLKEYAVNVLAEYLMSISGSDLPFNIQALIINALENTYGEDK